MGTAYILVLGILVGFVLLGLGLFFFFLLRAITSLNKTIQDFKATVAPVVNDESVKKSLKALHDLDNHIPYLITGMSDGIKALTTLSEAITDEKSSSQTDLPQRPTVPPSPPPFVIEVGRKPKKPTAGSEEAVYASADDVPFASESESSIHAPTDADFAKAEDIAQLKKLGVDTPELVLDKTKARGDDDQF